LADIAKTTFMKLLLIEDENHLAKDISHYLNSKDVHCEWANNFEIALEKINTYDYDCVLLDLMLPDGNGMNILKAIKKQQKNEGIIIISAKDTLESRLEGLELGADDYLTKPFHLSELLARVQAIIRRKQFSGNNILIFNEIEIDTFAKTVKVNQENIDLTKKEFDLLLYLIGNKNRVLSKSSLAEHLSGDMADMLDNHDFVYAHIKNLKRKLQNAGAGDYIKTIYGTGYKWEMI
jgi:DNA-binding response OmpR family regulator